MNKQESKGRMSRNWIAVASRGHVHVGQSGGFMQVCHGRVVPLRRIRPGDMVTYYSPTDFLGSRKPLRAFTAFGIVQAGDPYQVDMGEGFHPWRRDVDWHQDVREVPITPLLNILEFSRERKNWAYPLRFGLVEISDHDMLKIEAAMTEKLLNPYSKA